MPPSTLWPFPWWTAFIATLLIMLLPWLITVVRVHRRNRRLEGLGIALRNSGIFTGQDLFAIGEGQNVMLISRGDLAVADVKSWSIVQKLTWAETDRLKIYHNDLNCIEFRLVLKGGAQTRKIRTSIGGFGHLFIRSTREGKPVQYVQG
jgi:hypothetical protein